MVVHLHERAVKIQTHNRPKTGLADKTNATIVSAMVELVGRDVIRLVLHSIFPLDCHLAHPLILVVGHLSERWDKMAHD